VRLAAVALDALAIIFKVRLPARNHFLGFGQGRLKTC